MYTLYTLALKNKHLKSLLKRLDLILLFVSKQEPDYTAEYYTFEMKLYTCHLKQSNNAVICAKPVYPDQKSLKFTLTGKGSRRTLTPAVKEDRQKKISINMIGKKPYYGSYYITDENIIVVISLKLLKPYYA